MTRKLHRKEKVALQYDERFGAIECILFVSGDPVPVIITGPEVRVDDVCEYSEVAVAKGGLCRIRGADVMNIMMDLMNYAHKFGA